MSEDDKFILKSKAKRVNVFVSAGIYFQQYS